MKSAGVVIKRYFKSGALGETLAVEMEQGQGATLVHPIELQQLRATQHLRSSTSDCDERAKTFPQIFQYNLRHVFVSRDILAVLKCRSRSYEKVVSSTPRELASGISTLADFIAGTPKVWQTSLSIIQAVCISNAHAMFP